MSLSQAADDYVQFPITIQIGGDHRVRDGLPILELGPGAEAAFAVVEMWNPGSGAPVALRRGR